MKPRGAAAVSRTGSSVAFSWEQEPGVSKQGPVEAMNKPAALRTEADTKRTRMPASTKKEPAAVVESTTAHQHRLRVPPPPGGPGAPAVSAPPQGRSRPRRSRGVVRPGGDDPFLAAFLACTEGGSSGGQRLLGWARLGLGLGFGGFGLSCKTSCEAVEENLVRMARFPPKFTGND